MEVGKYYVPDGRLYPELVQYASKIYEKFRTNDTDALVVAQLLGHKSLSGAFNTKTALLSSYNLIERRAGKIKVTEIGKKIVYPSDPRERQEGVREALLKIPLWQALFDEFSAKGAELPSNFWADLARLADLAPEEAKNKADWVARAYTSDISYMKSVEKEIGSSVHTQQPTSQTREMLGVPPNSTLQSSSSNTVNVPPVASGQILFLSPDDKIQLSIPRSARHIGMLRAFVQDALKVIEDELVAEAELVTVQRKASKASESKLPPLEA